MTEVATVAGWCLDDHLEEAKRATHDTLIEMLGDQRRSGVRWHVSNVRQGALRVVYKMIEECRADGVGDDEPILQHYIKIRDMLTLHGGMLVVAMAEGTR